MSVDPAKKMNIYQKGKYLLRHAFEGDYLPYDILMREKAAFSDAVGHSLVDYLKEYAENYYTDDEFEKNAKHLHMLRLSLRNLFCTGRFSNNSIPVRAK